MDTIPSTITIFALFLIAAYALSGCVGGGGDDPTTYSPSGPQGQESEESEDETEEEEREKGPPNGKSLTFEVKVVGLYPYLLQGPVFDPDELRSTWGDEITIELVNEDLYPHDWTLEGVAGATTGIVDAQRTGSVTFGAPEPGEYLFYCSVEDHKDQGQTGTLVVNEP